MADGPGRARRRLLNVGLTALAFALLAWVAYRNRDAIRDVLGRRPDARRLAAALALHLAALSLTFTRWFVLVRALGLPFRVRDAMRLGFIGNVFNLVIPGAVGGDLVKAGFLVREQARRTQAVASMVIDRLVGLVGLFVLAGVAGATAWGQAPPSVRLLIALTWGAVAAGAVGLTILFSPRLYRPLMRLVAGRGKLEVVFAELVAVAESYRERVGTVAAMVALSMVSHGLNVAAFYLVGTALFPRTAPGLAAHYVLVPLVLFTQATPLPFGALGVTEAASGELFKLVNYPNGAVAMIGYRLLSYAGGLVSAIVFALNARQVRELTEEAEGPASPSPRGVDHREGGASPGPETP